MALAPESPMPEPRFRVRLVVDGRELPLKPFIHEMIGGAVMGLVDGLKGVEHPLRIELEVERIEPASPEARLRP